MLVEDVVDDCDKCRIIYKARHKEEKNAKGMFNGRRYLVPLPVQQLMSVKAWSVTGEH